MPLHYDHGNTASPPALTALILELRFHWFLAHHYRSHRSPARRGDSITHNSLQIKAVKNPSIAELGSPKPIEAQQPCKGNSIINCQQFFRYWKVRGMKTIKITKSIHKRCAVSELQKTAVGPAMWQLLTALKMRSRRAGNNINVSIISGR